MEVQWPSWVHVELPKSLENIGFYMWQLFADCTQIRSDHLQNTGNRIVISPTGNFAITSSFERFLNGEIQAVADQYSLPSGLSEFAKQEPLACCFYLINSLHEYLLPEEKGDHYGRYPWKASIQYQAQITEENYCENIFANLYQQLTGQHPQYNSSRIDWSHDIDLLFSEWKYHLILGLRHRSFTSFLTGVKHLLNPTTSHWNNIDEIIAIEKKYSFYSTFYFLTEKGKYKMPNGRSISHADYDLAMSKLQAIFKSLYSNGFFIGLHKSAFSTSFLMELRKFPFPIEHNRNHFLKFRLPGHYHQIESAGLKYDASLGFPEHFGFRNSYGRPFQPFNLKENRPFRFIEYPLHLMDATFTEYLEMDDEKMRTTMLSFIQKHSKNCVLGILLHNNRMNLHDKSSRESWYQFYHKVRELIQ